MYVLGNDHVTPLCASPSCSCTSHPPFPIYAPCLQPFLIHPRCYTIHAYPNTSKSPSRCVSMTCGPPTLRRPTPQVRATSIAVAPRHARVTTCATPRQSGPRSEPHPCWIRIVLYIRPFNPLSYILLSFFRLRPSTPNASFCAPLDLLLPFSHYLPRAYMIPLSSPWPRRPSIQNNSPAFPFSFRLRAATSSHSLRPSRSPFARS